jgi:hypothetical protein
VARLAVTSPAHRERFLRGLLCRSPLVLVVALGFVALALLGLQALFTSGAFAVVRESVLLRQNRDDFFHDSYLVGRLKLHHPAHLPIYVIGGSAARESLVSEPAFAAVVRQATGVPVDAYVLCNYNQDFGESLAIVDNLPAGGGVVVIAVNNNRFHFSPAGVAGQLSGSPLLLSSPTLRAFVAANPAHGAARARLPGILPGVMGYLVQVADAKFRELVKTGHVGVAYKPHWVTARKMWTTARKRAGVKDWITSRGKAFFTNYAYNARLLDVLVARAQERGFKVVLIEETENTAIVGHSFDRFKRVYKPIVRRIAAEHDVPYLDLQAKLRLPNADFWDYIHPVEPARIVWQRVLADALKPVVRQAAAARGSSGA